MSKRRKHSLNKNLNKNLSPVRAHTWAAIESNFLLHMCAAEGFEVEPAELQADYRKNLSRKGKIKR